MVFGDPANTYCVLQLYTTMYMHISTVLIDDYWTRFKFLALLKFVFFFLKFPEMKQFVVKFHENCAFVHSPVGPKLVAKWDHWDHSETKYVHVSIALLPQDVTSWPGPCEPLQCIQP